MRRGGDMRWEAFIWIKGVREERWIGGGEVLVQLLFFLSHAHVVVFSAWAVQRHTERRLFKVLFLFCFVLQEQASFQECHQRCPVFKKCKKPAKSQKVSNVMPMGKEHTCLSAARKMPALMPRHAMFTVLSHVCHAHAMPTMDMEEPVCRCHCHVIFHCLFNMFHAVVVRVLKKGDREEKNGTKKV